LKPPFQTDEETYSLDNAEHFCPVHIHKPSISTSKTNTGPQTLVFKSSPDGLYHGIFYLRTLMHDMKVFSSSLSHNSRVPFVLIQISRDVFPQFPEHMGGAGEVKRRKGRMGDGLCDNFWWRTRNKLDYTWRNAGFREDLMDDVVGVGGGW
jgi:hypothetical protein